MTDQIEANAAASITLSRSVVPTGYKMKYAQREAAMKRRPKDIPRKALARCNGDWLALELARYTLDEKGALIVALFEQVLDENGVVHSHWNRTTKGWQGRLKMTGRLALQRKIAVEGVLVIDGEAKRVPANFVAKHGAA